ncbi:MAG: lytic transglycosylase domain-containing protein [Geobacteraceae bacterium]|nr:lytic transglycosylase domain-containing protein [Geobacteraceae bacterium]
MSIDIQDSLSLVTPLLAKGIRTSDTQLAGIPQDGAFAGRLERALKTSDLPGETTPLKAQELAETLNLQMLQTTLSLGDNPAERPAQQLDRQSPQFQALVRAYASNQPETVSQPSPQPGQPSQLQELAETPSNNPAVADVHAPQGLDAIITKASQRYGVDSGLIKAVIKAESGFNPNAVSPAGARGLMQLMPGTARVLGVNDSFDPEQNVMGGTRFLRDLLKRYNGHLDSALAAYNWGPGNVDRNPVQLPRETRQYLARVKQLYSSYSA